ncbi:MAG: hypothetical protein P1U89_20805 [Verrucomicrobiales bacterium]|nr:hypothetical protein [Verrucomicrobiales bacterium]
MTFVESLKDHWGRAALSSLSFLRAAATSAPIPEYREAARQLLAYYREPIPDDREVEGSVWHTRLQGQAHMERVFNDFRLLIVPRYGGEGTFIRDYDFILQIHISDDASRPQSFDDIAPFLGGWKTGYRGSFEAFHNDRGISITAPLRFETSPDQTFAEAKYSVPTVALGEARISFCLTTESGHWEEEVEIFPVEAIPEGWKAEHEKNWDNKPATNR